MATTRARWFFGCVVPLLAVGATACKPDFGSPASLVTFPRILAVRGVPAEAAPGKAVVFDALAVEPGGTIADPGLGWAFCHQPKPPAEANAVAGACLDGPDDAGPAPTYMASVPSGVVPVVDPSTGQTSNQSIDSCSLFGPQTPPPAPGQPPIRPRDADVTGGFYQPLRVVLPTAGGARDITFELQRITCPLANAPVDVTRAFNMVRDPAMPSDEPCCYTANVNPTIAHVTLNPGNMATELYAPGSPAGPPSMVPAGAKVALEVSWDAAAPETYPVWDPATRTLTTHRESLRVSWFASAGSFDLDTSGRGEDETLLFTRNDWTAPVTAGTVHAWVVLRDARGGLDFAAFDLMVVP